MKSSTIARLLAFVAVVAFAGCAEKYTCEDEGCELGPFGPEVTAFDADFAVPVWSDSTTGVAADVRLAIKGLDV